MSDYLKKRKRNQSKHTKKNNFSVKIKKQEKNYEEIQFLPTEDISVIPEEFLKIGKFWQGSCLIEPKNTSGKLVFIEEDNLILSQVENELHIINQTDLNLIKKISQKEESILAFTYNSKKKEIICSMSNSLIRVYDLFNVNKCKYVWKLNKESAKILRVDKAFKFIALATSSNKILVYDSENFKLLSTFSEHSGFIYDLQFNPDKEKFLLYSASEDGSVKIWDIILNKCLRSLEGHSNSVRILCQTNDGRSLIAITSDNNIYVWKLGNKSEDTTLLRTYNSTKDITSAFYFTRIKAKQSKDLCPSLLLGCEDGVLCEFDLKTGQTHETSNLNICHQAVVQISYLASINKLFLLTSDQTIIDLHLDLTRQEISHSTLIKIYPGYCQEILDIKFLKPKNSTENEINFINSKFLFSSNDNNLKYFNKISDTEFEIQNFEGHSDFIMHIDVKDDYITTSSKDGTVRIWKYDFGENSKFQMECIAIIKGHSEAVNASSLLLKSAKKKCVSISKDKTIKLWELDLDKRLEVITQSYKSEMAHSEEVNVVKVSPNEKMIASGSYDKTINIYNNELKVIGSISGHKRAITDLNFSQYAKLLASSSTDKTIKVWNLNDFSCINTFEGHLGSVLKVQWVYCGTHILSSGADGLAKLWNLKTSECLNTINAHEGKIWALDVLDSRDTKSNICQFVTGGTDSKIMLWTDITHEKEKENLEQEEDKLLKKEKLRFLNENKNYYEGMSLSLELNHKNEFLTIFRNFFDDIYKNKNGQTQNDSDQISLIINNRKCLEENSGEYNSLEVATTLKKTISNIINDQEFKNIVLKNLDKILEITRDFSIKTTNFLYAQILLKFILVSYKHEIFSEKEASLGKRNKKLRTKKEINYIDNFSILKSYSEKHLERINREIIRAYLIDFVIEKMKII
jgi:U3 small nucleolar RNA-associated protein 13